MKKKRWMFNGIKRFFPDLSYEDWIKICQHGYQSKVLAKDVIACLSKSGNSVDES
jgi:hypothetical protein